MKLVSLVFLGALVAAACSSKKDSPSGGSAAAGSAAAGSAVDPAAGSAVANAGAGSAAGSGAGSAAPVGKDDAPITDVVTEAFGGTLPTLPQLSKDGATVATAKEDFVGLTEFASYGVELAGVDGTSKVLWVVDDKLAERVFEADRDGKELPLDKPALTKAASAITKQLADGGFTRFEVDVAVPVGTKGIAVGPVQLTTEKAKDGALQLALAGTDGKELAKDSIKPINEGKTADGLECVTDPSVRHAWFDAARKRVLVEVLHAVGSHDCSGGRQYKLYAVK